MITQCEIRKLYSHKNEPHSAEAIEVAKTFERRRCGHHPDEYPEPLSTEECLESVVDPKNTGVNKHRYVVASQAQEVRRMLRGVRGTPLIYIKRSVMILEPMADESAQVRAREEKAKFRAEIRKPTGKRKRDQDDEGGSGAEDGVAASATAAKAEEQKSDKKKKKYGKGPKGPNPLSVKKAKKTKDPSAQHKPAASNKPEAPAEGDAPAKRKRRRKSKASSGEQAGDTAATAAGADGE